MKNHTVRFVLLLATAALMVGFMFAPPVWASRGQVLITDVNGTPVDLWKVGDTLYITVRDIDENRDSDEVELIGVPCLLSPDELIGREDGLDLETPTIELRDPNTGDVESCEEGLILQETGTNTGVFRSQAGIPITKGSRDTAEPGNLTLEVQDNDTIFVVYQDISDPTDVDGDLAKIQRTRAIIAITDRAGNPKEIWNVGEDVFVTVTDADENISPVTVESITVILMNPRIEDDEEVTLVETGANTGVFRNPDGVLIRDAKGTEPQSEGELEVLDKDTIVAFYRDSEEEGDPNDRSDFALDDAKIAEPNPAVISLTDVNGTEKREFRIGEDLFITVKDEDANTDSDRVECIIVRVVNINGGREGFAGEVAPPCAEAPDLEGFALYETGVNSSVFRNPNALKIVGVNTPEGQEEWDEEAQEFIDDVPGILAVHNGDTFYVVYGDETAPTLDAFDSDFATATITDTQVFSVVGGTAVNKIKFTDDRGIPVSTYKVGQDLFVEIEDLDQNEDTDLVERIEVSVLDRDTGDIEVIILEETGPNTGVFRNRDGLPLCTPNDVICWPDNDVGVLRNDGILQMEDRDTLEAHYGPFVEVEDGERVETFSRLENGFILLPEDVEIDEEAIGFGQGDPNNPSDFSIVWLRVIPQPAIIAPTRSTTLFTDAAGRTVAKYLIGDNVYVTVDDADENNTPGVPDVLRGAVTLENINTGLSMRLDLTETGADTGKFISAAVSTAPGNPLGVEATHTLKATYIDPNDITDKSERSIKVEARELKCDAKKIVNAPNPFSVRTTFKCVTSMGIERVSVQVWDLSGRLVFDDDKPGDSLSWDGRGEDGRELSNGVYLYMVRVSGYGKSVTSKVQKLVILK